MTSKKQASTSPWLWIVGGVVGGAALGFFLRPKIEGWYIKRQLTKELDETDLDESAEEVFDDVLSGVPSFLGGSAGDGTADSDPSGGAWGGSSKDDESSGSWGPASNGGSSLASDILGSVTGRSMKRPRR